MFELYCIIPCNCEVLEGLAYVDKSAITCELALVIRCFCFRIINIDASRTVIFIPRWLLMDKVDAKYYDECMRLYHQATIASKNES
ncbi:MAG: hypothetical protein ACEY3J_02850 [Arsenophonus sp.]